MKKYINIWFCVVCAAIYSPKAFSQSTTSDLIITVKGNGASKNDKYSYSLYRGDTLLSITPITDLVRFEKKHPVQSGKYRIMVYKNDSLFQEFSDINLEKGYQVWYTINLKEKTSHEVIQNTLYDPSPFEKYPEEEFAFMEFNYGQGFIEGPDYLLRNFWRFAFGSYNLLPVTNRFGVGFNYVWDISLALPRNDTTLRPELPPLKRERMVKIGMDYHFFMRLSTYNMKAYSKNGIFLDIGAGYNLPVYFRHVAVYENHKDMTRKIHRFTDVSAFARLGIGMFALTVNYRIFDYVKSPFPQMPKINVGLALILRE